MAYKKKERINKNCLFCNGLIPETRSIKTKYCSDEHAIKYRNGKKKPQKRKCTNCLECGADITHQSSKTRYCKGTNCAKKAEYKRTGYEVTCEVCNEKFIAKGKNVRVHLSCVNHLKDKNPDVELECVFCKKEFVVPFQQRTRMCCSSSCASYYVNSTMDKGAANKKSSETKKKQFASGEIVPSFLGKTHSKETREKISKKAKERFKDPTNNPMYGKNHSIESREKMSKTRAERWISGDYNKSNMQTHGHAYFKKAGQEVFYRSLWEKRAMEILEEDDNVIAFEYEPFRIPYKFEQNGIELNKNYIPDLLVEYVDHKMELLEIKPDCYTESLINEAKFDSARKYCEERNIVFKIWTQEELGDIYI